MADDFSNKVGVIFIDKRWISVSRYLIPPRFTVSWPTKNWSGKALKAHRQNVAGGSGHGGSRVFDGVKRVITYLRLFVKTAKKFEPIRHRCG
jgi:hypothetical protein